MHGFRFAVFFFFSAVINEISTFYAARKTSKRKQWDVITSILERDLAIQVALSDVNYEFMPAYYENEQFRPGRRYDRFFSR